MFLFEDSFVDASICSKLFGIISKDFISCVLFFPGVKVFIEPAATMFLIGSEMHYSTDKLASRFVFNNPNEKSTCGCGESFTI